MVIGLAVLPSIPLMTPVKYCLGPTLVAATAGTAADDTATALRITTDIARRSFRIFNPVSGPVLFIIVQLGLRSVKGSGPRAHTGPRERTASQVHHQAPTLGP